MAKVTVTIDSPASPGVVFDYLVNFSSVVQWDPAAVEAQKISEGEIGLGTRFRVVSVFAGKKTPLEYELTSVERPNLIVLEANNKDIISKDTIKISSNAAGAVMTYQAELFLKRPSALKNAVVSVLFKRLVRNAAMGLRRELGKLSDAPSE